MASTSLSLPIAPNLSKENYDFQAIKMQCFLIASDLWDIVKKSFEALVKGAQLTKEQKKISKENSSKDAKALLILHSTVSDNFFSNYHECYYNQASLDRLVGGEPRHN